MVLSNQKSPNKYGNDPMTPQRYMNQPNVNKAHQRNPETTSKYAPLCRLYMIKRKHISSETQLIVATVNVSNTNHLLTEHTLGSTQSC